MSTSHERPVLNKYAASVFYYINPNDYKWIALTRRDVLLSFCEKYDKFPDANRGHILADLFSKLDELEEEFPYIKDILPDQSQLLPEIYEAESILHNGATFNVLKSVGNTVYGKFNRSRECARLIMAINKQKENGASLSREGRAINASFDLYETPGTRQSQTHASQTGSRPGQGSDTRADRGGQGARSGTHGPDVGIGSRPEVGVGEVPTPGERGTPYYGPATEPGVPDAGIFSEARRSSPGPTSSASQGQGTGRSGAPEPGATGGGGRGPGGSDDGDSSDDDDVQEGNGTNAADGGASAGDTGATAVPGGDGDGGPSEPDDNGGGEDETDDDEEDISVDQSRFDADLKEIFSRGDPGRLSGGSGRLILRKNDGSLVQILGLMKDNDLDPENVGDTCYAVVLADLISKGVIDHDGRINVNHGIAQPSDHDLSINSSYVSDGVTYRYGLLNSAREVRFKKFSQVMCVVAIHMVSQGALSGEVRWYNSFSMVKGNILNESKFTQVGRLIVESAKVGQILDFITVGDLLSENNVFKYRITRLSSARLVKQAIDLLPYAEILKDFDPSALLAYKRFDMGGIITQLAAGPLSVFCKGRVNPYKGDKVMKSLPLSGLRAIPAPPYHAATLRKAVIIFDAFGFPYGNWYQGKKAMSLKNIDDVRFEAKVKRAVEIIKAMSTSELPENLYHISNPDFGTALGNSQLGNLLKTWEST